MLKKFQDFAIKGNAFDLAVGVIIGAAFGGIVASLVGDIFMPVVGAVTGGLDFSNYFVGAVEQGHGRHAGRSEEAGRGAGVGQLPHHRHQFRDRRRRDVRSGQSDPARPPEGGSEARRRAAAAGGVADRNSRSAGEAVARITAVSSSRIGERRVVHACAVPGCRREKIACAHHRPIPKCAACLQFTCDASNLFMRICTDGGSKRMAQEQHLNGTEIFVVDDDETMRDTLSAVFAPEGCRVTCFAEGQSFLVAARARTPACILLDVNMPGRSGLDMLRELDAPHYPAPILIVSGQRDVPTAVNAIKGGALDFIEKPIEAAAVIARVREAIMAGRGVRPSATAKDQAGRGQGRRTADAARARGAGAGRSPAPPTRRPAARSASARAPSRCIAPASWTSSAPRTPPTWCGSCWGRAPRH